jgi:hypothetical protein
MTGRYGGAGTRTIWRALVLGLALLSGCMNPLHGPPELSGPGEGGQVCITIGSGMERTVFPQMEQFSKIVLSFERKNGSGTMSPVEVSLGETIISLSPGSWEVTASAYNAAEPPLVVARAVNTLTRTGDRISGETYFALAPTGTGSGTLRYTITPPEGLTLNGAGSRIRIEQDGEALAALNSGGFSGGTRPLSGAIAGGTVSLAPGRYMVDIVLGEGDGLKTAVYREAAAIVPGLLTEIVFAPEPGDFLDPDARAALTNTAGIQFGKTAYNSSATVIGAAGGGELNKTQLISAPNGKETVYFTLKKAASQTAVLGGADADRVSISTGGNVEGMAASNTLLVFAVDTASLAGPGGNREFTLSLGETGKTPVVYALTVQIASLLELYIDELPEKRVYRKGEALDLSGIKLRGVYSNGAELTVPASEVDAVGFNALQTGKQRVNLVKYGVTARWKYYIAGGSAYEDGFEITLTGTVQSELLFYCGWGGKENPQPNRFSVVLGERLVLAPVKWLIPDTAAYEWKVDGVTQSSTGEYLTFSPASTGTYQVKVTTMVDGAPISAETTVVCVAPPSSRPIISGSSKAKSAKLYTYLAPGQFGELGQGSLFGSGGYGGYTVFKFDHSISRNGVNGEELLVGGNAFGGWNEPGIIWVMRDENQNGQPDDTWYELVGSHADIAVRRHSVKYLNDEGIWVDNLGGGGLGRATYTVFTGTMLPKEVCALGGGQIWGYADVFDNGRVSLSNAVQMDGSPISLDFIDFVKIQTAVNYTDPIFGERSTEAGIPTDLSMEDPDKLIHGINRGDGVFEYTFTNDSGYDLTLVFAGTEFTLPKNSTALKTSPFLSEYIDFWGGNVNMIRSTGGARFTDG